MRNNAAHRAAEEADLTALPSSFLQSVEESCIFFCASEAEVKFTREGVPWEPNGGVGEVGDKQEAQGARYRLGPGGAEVAPAC